MNEDRWPKEAPDIPEPTDEELDAFAEFTTALVRGERPDLETFLALRPQLADRLRPSLEAAVWLKGQFDADRARPRGSNPDRAGPLGSPLN